MLVLLNSPAWVPPDQAPRPLPLTVPAALLLVLATQGGWMAREQLALVFWPDAAPADALHHLRINLHRAKQMLAGWGQTAALQTERARLRLELPSDLAHLRAAQAAPAADSDSANALARLNPTRWLRGWRLPGYDGFAQWCDETAPQLEADWLAASRRCQAGTGAALGGGPSGHAATGSPGAHGRLAATPQPPPGREAELQRLLHSPAPALLLLGEPGAGKTTLLHAAHPQAPVLRGLEGLHAMPYRPLLTALRELTPLLERALRESSHPLRPYRLDLARVLPELAPDEALPPLDALTAQTRLVEALTRAFEAVTPVLLVDDLQWCDSASVEWLLLLAHSGRLRWRAAARRHEVGADLQAALDSLHNAARLETVDVLPLSRAALALACAQRWPEQRHGEGQLDRLHALSGGNAFLLGELVDAGWATAGDVPSASVQARVARLVLARWQALPATWRAAVEAAAVLVQPVPAAALQERAEPLPAATSYRDDPIGSANALTWATGCQRAVDAGLLRDTPAGLVCRHDLVRQAITQALSPQRRAALHRHAALWLAAQASDGQPPDALTIAEHWRAAGDAQTSLAWCHRGAEQLKARGSFAAARGLWRTVADEALDAALGLRAQLELAACDLFEDLSRGEAALEAVQARLGAVADPEQHRQIEGRLRAALVDNRVFAGDIACAQVHAQRLRTLLPALPVHEQVDAVEVLIELAMREPDIPAAWALLAQLRAIAPQRPTLLSFEGQIHWFGGQVQAAHDALARLLVRHPDYCRGITVENDLAVMLQALGRIDEAEVMARRSLQSWAGVSHTETLSLLVLGLVLTSAGRHAEADAALLRALHLAREQASPGFEAEALVRRARLLLQMDRAAEAQQALDTAAPLLAHTPEPLRVSQLVLAQVQAATATGAPWPAAAAARLRVVAAGSDHPLVHVRLARVAHAQAVAAQDAAAAAQCAARMADTARRAGLLEPLADALLLQTQAQPDAAEAPAWAREAARLAERHGFADIRRRVTTPHG